MYLHAEVLRDPPYALGLHHPERAAAVAVPAADALARMVLEVAAVLRRQLIAHAGPLELPQQGIPA